MARRVIPLERRQPQAARNQGGLVIGITLVLLHLASIALALTYF